VAPFFSAADAFVMSSTSEGLPISLLQAFSMGLPAIVTDVGEWRKSSGWRRRGYGAVTDPAGMAAGILRLAENDAERAQFSKNAEQAFTRALRCKLWSMPTWTFTETLREPAARQTTECNNSQNSAFLTNAPKAASLNLLLDIVSSCRGGPCGRGGGKPSADVTRKAKQEWRSPG